jgi:hypothetical protein
MDVIADRRLELRTDKGSIDVTVKIGRPQSGPSAEDWICPYEIWVGDERRSMEMHGIDSIQALQLTIATLDVELRHSARKYAGTLFHYDEPFTSILESSGLEVRRS